MANSVPKISRHNLWKTFGLDSQKLAATLDYSQPKEEVLVETGNVIAVKFVSLCVCGRVRNYDRWWGVIREKAGLTAKLYPVKGWS